MESDSTTEAVANPAQGDGARAAGSGRTRVSDKILREEIDHTMKSATALLAENYLAQDRHRLIRCIELLNEATKAIEGGMWTAELAPERPEYVPPPPKAAPLSGSGLIARDTKPAPLREVA